MNLERMIDMVNSLSTDDLYLLSALVRKKLSSLKDEVKK